MIKIGKLVNILLSEKHYQKFELIAKNEYSDKSKLLRKWIDQNFKEEYNKPGEEIE